MRQVIIPLLLFVIFACETVEPIDRLADTYVDLLRFRDRTAKSDTSEIRSGIDSILTARGYTPDAYRAAFSSLADDPGHLPAFFARVEARMAATNPALSPSP